MISTSNILHVQAFIRGVCYRLLGKIFLRLSLGRGLRIWGPIRIIIDGKIVIGRNVHIGAGCYIQAAPGAEIYIGDGSTINTGCILVAQRLIKIGSNVHIGEYTSLRDADHLGISDGLVSEYLVEPIEIGSDVWVGRGCLIGKRAVVPAKSTIGANSIVTRPLTVSGTYVGAPARLTKALTPCNGIPSQSTH